MKHTCSKCGHQDEINPAKLLASIRTPKKEAAWKANGERLRRMYANARKVGGLGSVELTMDRPVMALTASTPPQIEGIMPKGSLKLDDLKALLASGGKSASHLAPGLLDSTGNPNMPRAPFDVNLEGEPHRVTQMGKKLGLFYMGGGEPAFNRFLAEGELEKFWEARIQ